MLKGFVASPRIELGFGVSETHVLSVILQGPCTKLVKYKRKWVTYDRRHKTARAAGKNIRVGRERII